jgi:hypothetical protein
MEGAEAGETCYYSASSHLCHISAMLFRYAGLGEVVFFVRGATDDV